MSVGGSSVLARVPLFAELTSEELDVLSACLRHRRYARGETIFLRGDPGSSLYIVESGRVKIVLSSAEGREFVLALLGPGDFFGELALLDGEPRSADAVAHETSQLLLLQRPDFLRFLDAHPRAAAGLLTVLSQRLRHDAEVLQDVAFLDVPARLARAILQLVEDLGQPSGEGTVVASRLTQAELAAMVGATRESINKWLGFYERQGLIRWEAGRLTVLKPDGLRKRIT